LQEEERRQFRVDAQGWPASVIRGTILATPRTSNARKLLLECKMAIRDFVDEAGVHWRVWDVRPEQPGLLERRHAERRHSTRPIAFQDRRRGTQRRTNAMSALRQGWLVFRSENERRRLFGDSISLDDASQEQLQQLLEQAQAAPSQLQSLDRIES
jgi:hypothetical protein